MKRFWTIFLLIFSLCLTLFFLTSKPFVSEGPAAKAGVADFRETDFSSSAYALSGQWEFYYGRLYTPEDFRQGNPEGMELIDLPGPWTRMGYPALGCATYHLKILTDPGQIYLLYIPEIMSSSMIWLNGEEFYRAGQVGTSDENTVTGVRNELLAAGSQDGILELVIQAANFRMNGSGIFYPLLIGKDTVLAHHIFWQRTAVAAALGGILLIGVYHLFLYLFRRRERLYLTFSITCLTTVLRLGMESNALVQYFLPGGIGFILSRVFLLLFTLHSLCICIFMIQVFSIRLNRLLRFVYALCFFLPMAGICLLPYAKAVNSMFLAMIPYAVSLVLAIRSGKIGRDPYCLLYLCSMVTFVIYGPLSKTVFEGDMFVPGIVPNMFLLLSQCVMLSRSYAQAHEEVERVNANLEALVEQRTAQLNSTNEQLAASQTALREMISNISHDLKTPLTVLNNYLELLGDETIASSERERTEYLGIAYHKNLDLQRLIQNLFEVTRMEGGTVTYRIEWFSVDRLMGEIARKYADLIQDKGLNFRLEADRETELHIDSIRIWSVLDNLVYNALRHTPKGGSIALSIHKKGDLARLQVADTGEGIEARHIPHIFERFYKVSQERGERDGSSGLGLYIVKTTVEAMGGTVEVESKPGKGTVFTVTFAARSISDVSYPAPANPMQERR